MNVPVPKPVKNPTGAVKSMILAQAEALFMDQGLQGTSLADIATKAGISRGTLFYHFPTKDDLIMAIAVSHIEAISGEVLAAFAVEKDFLGMRRQILHLFNKVLAAGLRNQLHLYLVEEAMVRNPALKLALADTYEMWQGVFEDALGCFLGAKAGPTAQRLITVLDGLVIQKALGRTVDDLEVLVDMVLGL